MVLLHLSAEIIFKVANDTHKKCRLSFMLVRTYTRCKEIYILEIFLYLESVSVSGTIIVLCEQDEK